MADGLNQIRAMRIAEIIQDFRTIQTYIASIRAAPSAEEYHEDGYALLRKCVADAQVLLAIPFHTQGASGGSEEQAKAHLKRIITDAAVRRFKAQRIYLRATAALRWVNTRAAVLQGHRAHAGHAPALQQIRNALRSEVGSITDQRVEYSLRSVDIEQGKWLDEDPSLSTLQRIAGNGQSHESGDNDEGGDEDDDEDDEDEEEEEED